MTDSALVAHVADSIERVGGDATDYDGTAEMAAQMLTRFPAVRYVAGAYAHGEEEQGALDHTVSEALAVF